jgi:adenosylcobyric acid synthase
LLDIDTTLADRKTLRPIRGRLAASGAAFAGYEMHVGLTTGPGLARPFLLRDDDQPDGAVSADGRIAGAYAHGLFDKGEARRALLDELGALSAPGDHPTKVDAALDEIAATLAHTLDIDTLARIAGL